MKEKARFDGVRQVEPDRRGFKLASIEFHEHLRYDDVMQSTMHDVDNDVNNVALPSQVVVEEAGALYIEVSRNDRGSPGKSGGVEAVVLRCR